MGLKAEGRAILASKKFDEIAAQSDNDTARGRQGIALSTLTDCTHTKKTTGSDDKQTQSPHAEDTQSSNIMQC